MLRDRYEIDKFFVEIQGLTSEMEPALAHIDKVLDDEAIYQMVKTDLSQRYPKTQQTGRRSTPVEVILRMLVVRHLYQLSYEKTEKAVKDSLVLRRFCRVYFEAVPDDTTLIRWHNQISPETIKALHERVVQIACELKVTKGRKLRTDGTVVETNIHYPSDSSLLRDGVRVLSRYLKQAQQVVGIGLEHGQQLFRNRSGSARRLQRQIEGVARKGAEKTRPIYQKLLRIARASVQQAQTVIELLKQTNETAGDHIQRQLQTFVSRTQPVIEQTLRRVVKQAPVAASHKLVSLFEPHTDIIKRGKAGHPTEFGHKVWLDEVDGGIVSDYRILQGNPADSDQWQPAIDTHVEQFGKAPHQASADRGVYSAPNEAYATARGVKRVILPKAGYKSQQRQAHERQPWFRRGRPFHAGVEGRISVLKRNHGLDRCLNHGLDGFARWVGWGIIANNLSGIARQLVSIT
ncbi:MAG: ISNCY family transposase [Anaerolineae bacterium]|nr:ISNCY family transposase [Anaerolineae bacterium]